MKDMSIWEQSKFEYTSHKLADYVGAEDDNIDSNVESDFISSTSCTSISCQYTRVVGSRKKMAVMVKLKRDKDKRKKIGSVIS